MQSISTQGGVEGKLLLLDWGGLEDKLLVRREGWTCGCIS